MISLSMSRRTRAMMGVSAFAIAAVAAAGVHAQAAQSSSQASNDSASQGGTVKEVVVTGQRASLRSAQQIKKNSDQIVDSITATDIGALPDRSVSEALQRVSGVTISRMSDPRDTQRVDVEGGGVQIRGLSYVESLLDGRDSFSAKNGRSLSFDDVPPELMAGVDVYKNPSAELIEGGVGGTVDLRTRLPFDQPGHVLAFSADESWGDLVNKWKPSGSILASNRWQTPVGEFGLLADLSYSDFASRTDTVSIDPYWAHTDLKPGATVYVPGGFGYRSLTFDRKRQGIDVAAQWRPNDQLLITAKYFQSSSDSTESENAVGIDPDSATSFYPASGTDFSYTGDIFNSGTFVTSQGGTTNPISILDERYNTTYQTTSDYSLNFKYTPTSRLTLSADVQYIHSKMKATDFTIFDTTTSGSLDAITLDLRGQVPTIKGGSSFNLSDPSQYYWNAAMDYHNHNVADEWAERVDGTYTFDSDWLKSFRFGVRHTDRDADTRETSYNWGYITESWTNNGQALLNGSYANGNAVPVKIPYATMPFSNFFGGGVSAPAFLAGTAGFMKNFVSAAKAIEAVEAGDGGWTAFNGNYSNVVPTNAGAEGVNLQHEETWAGYGSLKFGHDLPFFGGVLPMDGNLGLRIVSTKASGTGLLDYVALPGNYAGAASEAAFSNGASSATSGGRTYTNALPSLNVRFKLQPDLFLRLAAAKSIVRPNFSQMQSTTSVVATGGQTAGGVCGAVTNSNNPDDCVQRYNAYSGMADLKPIRANSYDASLEWYFAKTGNVTLDLFYKDIYDFISTENSYVNFTNNGVTENVLWSRPVNEGHGIVRGLELSYLQYFDFLPGPLKGFGLQGNFTLIDSQGARNASADPYDPTQIVNAQNQVQLPLEGLSRHAYNVALLYDHGPISARLAYNWREKYLLTTSAANINIPAWANDFGQLDASAYYSVTKNIKVGVEAANIGGSVYRTSVSYPTTPNPGMTGNTWVDADRRVSIVLRGQF